MSNGSLEEPSSSDEHDRNAPQMPTPEALSNWSTSELLEAENFISELDGAVSAPPSGELEPTLGGYWKYPTTENEDFHENSSVRADTPQDIDVNQVFEGPESEEQGEETSDDGDDPDYEDQKRGAREDAPQPVLYTSAVAVAPGTYTNMDVLMGRGGRSNHHHGNQLYLRDKKEMRQRYLCAKNKPAKTKMAEELVSKVHQRGGRFVRMKESSGEWEEVEFFVARKKASQSLREDSSQEKRKEKREKYGSTTRKRRKR